MSYLGKEYKFVKSENMEAFAKAIGLTGDRAQRVIDNRAPQKIVQNADGSYTITSSKEITFKSGEEFEKDYGVLKAKVTIVVDGNTVTEVQTYDEIVVTITKQFTDNELVETIKSKGWDGTAKVYFKA